MHWARALHSEANTVAMNEPVNHGPAALTAFETKLHPSGPANASGCGWRLPAWAMSRDLWLRVVFLFAALGVVKVVMLAGFRKYLFEIHWRVATQPNGWVSQVAFFVFVLLIGANLW